MFRPVRRFPVLIATVLAMVASISGGPNRALADVYLEAGITKVRISPSRCWTVYNLWQNGQLVCNGDYSNQGTVIRIGSEYYGSGHGQETVLDRSLTVDGSAVALSDGSTYSGTTLILRRHTNLAGAFDLVSDLTVDAAGLHQTVRLTGLAGGKKVETMYGFLESWVNSFSKWAAYDGLGHLLSSGGTDDSGGNILLADARAVGLFDPVSGQGVLCHLTQGYNYSPESFIWDRSYDNKLYARLCGLQGVVQEGAQYTFTQETLFYTAAESGWHGTAGLLVPEPVGAALIAMSAFWIPRRRRRCA